MKETQQYIITDDTASILKAIDSNLKSSWLTGSVEKYVTAVTDALREAFDQQIEVRLFPEDTIQTSLTEGVVQKLKDPEYLCLCLDRFLLSEVEQSFPDRFFRFSVTRNINGSKYPRQGGLPFTDQMRRIYERIPEVDIRKIILIDDGIFSGSTVKDFLNIWQRETGKQLPVTDIITFTGNSLTLEGINVQVLSPVDFLYEWIDLRDVGPWGGKQKDISRNNRVTSQIPYLFPWSNGEAASLDMNGNFLRISKDILRAASQIVKEYEVVSGRPLRFRDMVKQGFGVPTDQKKLIPVSINQRVSNYLDSCYEMVEQEEQRKVYIFDMDGTLYQLNGENNGYKGSTLEQKVIENAKSFIVRYICNGNEEEAETILQKGLIDPVGISMYLEVTWGIPRSTYFSAVWNINPEGIVQNYDYAVAAITELKTQKPEVKCILLTAAPRVWAEQVLEYINIRNAFDLIYTGEQYKQKSDVFSILAQRYNPANMVSVGDQYRSDIKPAEEKGIRGILISKPEDITILKEIL